MLPFLRPKLQTGLLISTRKADGSAAPTENESSAPETDDIEACAQELIRAVHAKDAPGVAQAIRSAFEILESQPHAEGEHTNEG